MIKTLIENYVNKLTKEDIILYASKENIAITNDEVDYLYITIKKDYHLFINGNHDEIFEDLKPNVSIEIYNKLVSLYNKYKSFYKF